MRVRNGIANKDYLAIIMESVVRDNFVIIIPLKYRKIKTTPYKYVQAYDTFLEHSVMVHQA